MSEAEKTPIENSLEARIAHNRRRTVILGVSFGLLVFVVSALVLLILGGGIPGLLIAAIITGVWLSVAWFRADDVVLDLSEVEPADEAKHARLFNVSAGMCVTVGTSPPSLYVVEDTAVNAMSVGRDPRNASIVVTTGLLDELTVVELEAVIAEELVRIKLGETTPLTFLVPTVGAIAVLGEAADRWLWLQRILMAPMPLIERVILWIHSERDDVDTDIETVRLTRYPPALASALQKMQGRSSLTMGTPVTAHLWLAPPLGLVGSKAQAAIHAPLSERISVIEEL